MGRGRVAFAVLALTGIFAGAVEGTDVDRLTVGRSGAAYTIDTAVLLPADAALVRTILASPDLLTDLNDGIRSVETLPSKPGESTLRIVSRRCVLFFCRDYTWVQTLWVDESGDVRARFEPGTASAGASSVSDGEILYRIDPVSPGRARVEVSARIVPSVDLPPLVGPALMRNALADDMTMWSANIARLSREAAAGDRVLIARWTTTRPLPEKPR